ncbi:hypothetical protein Rleg9DRAFT_1722 [Rhizobium leguminosarum bv. trifolii WSM597]|uniref:Uncharacterized protein n=1 Tax=Rhizobium leguminosarum bv. trifolii WSM597 TaxID=754764 RepID=J0GZ90_RHILT|nr:hypothetical protein [Rhizobium leguminosarum]EJB02908.1 hypothetical protein Rleg9DRAFT_1722 [Rhizobium leguminosarum bv. trifolii WSM597]
MWKYFTNFRLLLKHTIFRIVVGVAAATAVYFLGLGTHRIANWYATEEVIQTAWAPLPFLSSEACAGHMKSWLANKNFKLIKDWEEVPYDVGHTETESLNMSNVRDSVANYSDGEFDIQVRCIQSMMSITYVILSTSTSDATRWNKLSTALWQETKRDIWSVNAYPAFGGKNDIFSQRDGYRWTITMEVPPEMLPRIRAEGRFPAFIKEHLQSRGFRLNTCGATSCSFGSPRATIWIIIPETDYKKLGDKARPAISLEVIGSSTSYDRYGQWLFDQKDYETVFWSLPGVQNVALTQKDWSNN